LTQTNWGRPNPRWARRNAKPRWQWPQPPTNWDDQVEAILDSEDLDPASKNKELLELMPKISLDSQVEVAAHLNENLPNEDYDKLLPYFTNSATAEPVIDVLMAGLAERPDDIRLPLLLMMAEDSQNAKSADALDYLESILGENFGTNWDQLNATVIRRLQGGPDPDDEEMATGPP
jgi:hypothetical protein